MSAQKKSSSLIDANVLGGLAAYALGCIAAQYGLETIFTMVLHRPIDIPWYWCLALAVLIKPQFAFGLAVVAGIMDSVL